MVSESNNDIKTEKSEKNESAGTTDSDKVKGASNNESQAGSSSRPSQPPVKRPRYNTSASTSNDGFDMGSENGLVYFSFK